MKTLIFLFLICFTRNGFSQEWNINDVSYLFPLPNKENKLIKASDYGAFGKLIPDHAYTILPTILPNFNRTKTFQNLNVVAVRLDPCFQDAAHRCLEPQLRFVWQVVHFDTNKKTWTTEDGAFHTFYSLKAHELEAIKHELWQLKLEALESGITTHQLPLGVHPSLKSSKTQKYFHQKLVKILLKYAGDQKLTQMTFMSLLSPHRWWQFGGFQLINRQWKEIKIPRLKSTHMDLFNMDMTINPETGLQIGMNASISILPSTYPYQDNFQAIINKISRENIPQTIELYQSKMMAINRFENPLTTNPNNLDCASCHFTEATRYYILSKFPQLKTILEDAYANPDPKIHNMQNQSIETQSTKIVRAFGYFGSQAAFSQRVIHDSVETAHFFNR